MASGYDTFAGLALDTSIQGATMDAGGMSWASPTYLVGDGNGNVKVSGLPNGFYVVGNVVLPSNATAASVDFIMGSGKPTSAEACSISIHGDGSSGSQYGTNGIVANVGSYGTLKVKNSANGEEAETPCELNETGTYRLEIQWPDPVGTPLKYRANVYTVTGGVRSTSPIATKDLTITTAARPTTARTSQLGAPGAPNLVYSRYDWADAAVADTTAPTLTNASVTPSSISATGSITTNEGNGTLYYLANSTASPTDTAVKAGSSQAVSASGVQNVTVNSLLASTSYYLHFLHRDAAGNDSAITSVPFTTTASGADTTPPTLVTPSATATSSTTATGTVSTNEAGGTLYYLVSANSSESAATVKAGSSQTVTATGQQSVSITGLTGGTTRYIHFLHRDAAGNDSTVASSSSFTTPAVDNTAPAFAGGAAITAGTITSSSLAFSYPAATDNVAVTGYDISKDGGSTWTANGTGLNGSFSGLTANTAYQIRVRAKDAAGNFSTPLSLSMTTSAASTGTFTTDQWHSSGTLRANQAFTGTWYSGGAPGTAGGTATLVSGTLSSTATATITVPKGAGFFIGATSDGGRYYQEGTVA